MFLHASWRHLCNGDIFTFITHMSPVTSLRPELFVHLSQTIVAPSLEVSSWAVLSLGRVFLGQSMQSVSSPSPEKINNLFRPNLVDSTKNPQV